MDPDANLKEQLELAQHIVTSGGNIDDSYRLAELVIAMNHWLSRGGFYPDAWGYKRNIHQ